MDHEILTFNTTHLLRGKYTTVVVQFYDYLGLKDCLESLFYLLELNNNF